MKDVNKKETEETSKKLAHDHWTYIQKTLEKQNVILGETLQKSNQRLRRLKTYFKENDYGTTKSEIRKKAGIRKK